MISTFTKVSSKFTSACKYSFKKSVGLNIRPFSINFILTYRCNSYCTMCNIWKRYKNESNLIKSELNIYDIEKFLNRNSGILDNTGIGITGGEPLLRDDIVDIAKLISKSSLRNVIGIQTNGLLTEKILSKVCQIKPLFKNIGIGVSLDGLGSVHDEIRGVSGAFEKAVATIKGIRELGIRVSVGMTLSSKNYNKILEVRDFLKKFDVDFTVFLPENSMYFANEGHDFGLTRTQLDVIAAQLKAFHYHYYMDNLRRFISNSKKRTLPCWSGYTSIVIDPYGNVFPCILRNESFGNIKEQSLEELLFSKKGKKTKESLKNCYCWSQCEVSVSAITSPFDVMRWFLLECHDKKSFLNDLSKKRDNLG